MYSSTMQPLPQNFARHMIELYGERGRAWLQALPALLARCAQRWSLTIEPPFALSYNYVAPARRADGTDVVLKIGVPNPELTSEIEALRLYDGHGIVRLLDVDEQQGVMLLERLQPGTMLSSLTDDEQATQIAAQVMRQLWQPVPAVHPFPTVARWARGLERLRSHFEGGVGPFPAKLVVAAEVNFATLLNSMTEPLLLHGDLHHENILAAKRQPWLAIDPKGVVGEPTYEIGAFLRNQIQTLTPAQRKQVLARRVDIFAHMLDLDRDRIVAWGLAQAVLSAWWSFEDHGNGWQQSLSCAETLVDLL